MDYQSLRRHEVSHLKAITLVYIQTHPSLFLIIVHYWPSTITNQTKLGTSVLLLVIVTFKQSSPSLIDLWLCLIIHGGFEIISNPSSPLIDWTLLPWHGPRPNWTAALALPNLCESCWVRTPAAACP